MNRKDSTPLDSTENSARQKWQDEFDAQTKGSKTIHNRSGIEINPLYTPQDLNGSRRREGRRPDSGPQRVAHGRLSGRGTDGSIWRSPTLMTVTNF